MSAHLGTSRWRLLAACFALVANLFAAGVPVLHGFAHDADVGREQHHHAAAYHHGAELHAEEAGHGHGRAHAASLHDECVAVKRAAVDAAVLTVCRSAALVLPATDREVPLRPVERLSSRGPPPGDPARAPPLV